MKNKILYLLTVIVQIAFFVIFYLMEDIDVIQLLLLVFFPMIISVILLLFVNLPEKKPYKIFILFALPNFLFSIAATVVIQPRIDGILERSMKYQSGNLEVTASNSIFGSLFLILIGSFILHYVFGQLKFKLSRT